MEQYDDTETLEWATTERLRYELEKHPDYDAYREWRSRNPKVYELFVSLSLACVNKQRHFGMWLIANKLRWDYWWEHNEEFKISNDYTALITREIMLSHPVVKTFCRIKRMRWADDYASKMAAAPTVPATQKGFW